MKNEPNKKAVGVFLILGFALIFGLIGNSVIQKLQSDKTNAFVMYFSESLQGLSEGSPIIFKGVEVGKVTQIHILADTDNYQFNAIVQAKAKHIDVNRADSRWAEMLKKENFLDTLVAHGLRARLATQSYLTGQLMIELVMMPDAAEPVHTNNASDLPEIPTILSKKEQLAQGLNNIQIQETIVRINNVADILENDLPVLLTSLTQNSRNLNKTLEKVAAGSDETIANLNETLRDVSDAAKSMQNLTDYLERHPESIIKGKKGE